MQDVQVVKTPQLYTDVKGICDMFDLSDSTTRRLVHEMQQSKKWKKSVIAYGRMLRIKISDFESFFQAKSY